VTAVAALSELGDEHDERWRYTPVDEIVARIERSVPAVDREDASLPHTLIGSLTGGAAPRLVFVNGFYATDLSDHDIVPAGVHCGVSGAGHVHGAGLALVCVGDGTRSDQPIHVVHLALPDPADGRSVTSFPRTLIDVGADARVTVVETYGGLDGLTLSEASTAIRVGDRAELAHHRLQVETPTATHIGHTRVDMGAASVLRHTSVTLGGDIARHAIEVHLDAADARAELAGINVTGDRQRHDTVVTVDHAASRCASTQRFAGVVDDHGRGSFSGEIIVRPGTNATDAHQSTRNLVLGPNAEADARPWLTILADDVRCTHGATVGRLDEDALHYLRSRGIELAQARAMLTEAFARDITDSISDEKVRVHIAGLVAAAATRAERRR
jgi:Fe-S cluster assembly protein SufD